MKRKDSPSCKDSSTSRYFRGVADPELPGTDGVNRDAEVVITRPFERCGSNVDPISHSQPKALGEHLDNAPKGSPISDTAAGQQYIQQVSEVR
jgi:hypothetical protein